MFSFLSKSIMLFFFLSCCSIGCCRRRRFATLDSYLSHDWKCFCVIVVDCRFIYCKREGERKRVNKMLVINILVSGFCYRCAYCVIFHWTLYCARTGTGRTKRERAEQVVVYGLAFVMHLLMSGRPWSASVWQYWIALFRRCCCFFRSSYKRKHTQSAHVWCAFNWHSCCEINCNNFFFVYEKENHSALANTAHKHEKNLLATIFLLSSSQQSRKKMIAHYQLLIFQWLCIH